MKRIAGLPFDQYQRYRLAQLLFAEVRPPGGRLRVLDVGGRTGNLQHFLPDDRVVAVDLEPAEGTPSLVLGDGAALPFADRSFDAVFAFDTLEHVPPPLRTRFVRECARVARQWVFVIGPWDAPRVREAEALLRRFLTEKLAFEHRYLEEHHRHGLPDRAATERELASLGASVVAVGHGGIERWLALMCLSMYLDLDASLRPLARAVWDFYNEALFAADFQPPFYRHALVAALGGAPLPAAPAAPAGASAAPASAAAALAGPSAAPSDSSSAAFGALLGELACFDRERDAWRTERTRFEDVVATLERDLAGHSELIGALRAEQAVERAARADEREAAQAERERFAQVVATLERDLKGHAELVAAVRAEQAVEREAREGERTAAVADRARFEEAVATLERDLAGHRGLVAELRNDLTEQREQVAARDRRIAELLDELRWFGLRWWARRARARLGRALGAD